MNIAVVGSRSFTDYEFLKSELESYVTGSDSIVSGGAKGVDSLAERFSREVLGKEPIIFEADWDDFSEPCKRKIGKYGEYNALAGFKRNTTIVENSDLVIAFWNEQSRGTKDTIDKAKERSIPTIIIDL